MGIFKGVFQISIDGLGEGVFTDSFGWSGDQEVSAF